MESGIVNLKDVKKLIFQQKRQVLNNVVLVGGRTVADNDPKRIEIVSAVPGSLYENQVNFIGCTLN